ncbi:M56 family metallopeptidase [Phycisphaerales bacterium AB-hyl4]|uniref:M56 family metallopeptidase n=1 Tax=Natronomicrosphaera hydrolytica TaxID=3242702 RepID=A0ABV4U328_9BACT
MQAFMPIVLDATIKASLVLLLALGLSWALRRHGSAAGRHLVWTLAVVAVLLLPAGAWLLPAWQVLPSGLTAGLSEPTAGVVAEPPSSGDRAPTAGLSEAEGDRVRPSRSGATLETWVDEPTDDGVPAAQQAAEAEARAMPSDATFAGERTWTARVWSWWWALLPWVWLGGVCVALLPIVVGGAVLWWIERTAEPIVGGSWLRLLEQSQRELGLRRRVALLRSDRHAMPMTWGGLPSMLRHPAGVAKVLVPTHAYHWTPARRRAVLLHELAHVKRWDCLTQLLTQIACAVYWFNPLMWYARRRMLIERERACDDLVLLHQTRPSDYAEHLMQIAAGAPPTVVGYMAAHAPGSPGIAMARSSKLHGRLVAILDNQRHRQAMSRWGAVLTVLLIAGVAVPVACMRPADAAVDDAMRAVRADDQAAVMALRMERAVALVEHLAQGDYEQAREHFNRQMRRAQSAEQLEQLWQSLALSLGEYEGPGEPTPGQVTGYDVVYVPMQWERRDLAFQVVFDRAANIAGLWTVDLPGDIEPPSTPDESAEAEPEQADEPAADEPRSYSFRRLDYSLRDEPQRIGPRTLGPAGLADEPNPGDAIVLQWPLRWWSSHWSHRFNTAAAALTMEPGHPHLHVFEPGRRKVWVNYLDMPIDVQRYPILVFTYRARNVERNTADYVLYLDDGSGPDYGGLQSVRQSDLEDDGEVHTVTVDLRVMEPIDNIIGMAVGLRSPEDADEPTELELLDLRFESERRPRIAQVTEAYRVRVRDEFGEPVADAQVTFNAERRNWARQATTQDDGEASLANVITDDGPNMLRVEAAGRLPVEVREMPRSTRPMEVTLIPAAPYAGMVVDEEGEPLAGAVVRVRTQVDERTLDGLWTRRDAEAVTDERGRWQTLPLAASPTAVQIEVTHPAYSSGPQPSARHQMAVEPLLAGEAVLPIVAERHSLALNVRDEAGNPIDAPVSVQYESEHVVGHQGRPIRVDIAATTPYLLVHAHGYVPKRVASLVHLIEQDPGADLRLADFEQQVQLDTGREVALQLLDDVGEPLVDATVHLVGWQNMQFTGPTRTTDTQGEVTVRISEPVHVTVRVSKPDYVERRHYHIELTEGQNTLTVPRDEPTQPDADDSRRPGYDPQRIFRRLSHHDTAALPAAINFPFHAG